MNDRPPIASCAEFEAALAEALAEERGAPEAALRALRDHAESCEACAASSALIDLAALPAQRRDPVPLPDEARWKAIRDGARAGIARDRAGVAGRSRVRLGLAAAAAVVAVGWLGWVLWERSGRGVPDDPFEMPVAETEAPKESAPPWSADDWNDEVWAGASPIPDVDSLDSEEREALWLWLEEEGALDESDGGGDA